MPDPSRQVPPIQAALAELQAVQPAQPTPYEAALLAVMRQLIQQLTVVERQVQDQAQVIAELRALVPQSQPRPAPKPPPPPSPPKTPRPLEYWVANIPEYDGQLTAEEVSGFLTKPRVRPEDIPITPVAKKPPSYRYRYDLVQPSKSDMLGILILMIFVVLVVVVIMGAPLWLMVRALF